MHTAKNIFQNRRLRRRGARHANALTMHAMPYAKPSLGAVAGAMSQDLTDAVSILFAENLINIVVVWLHSAQFVLYALILHSTASFGRVRNNAHVSCALQQHADTMRHFHSFSG